MLFILIFIFFWYIVTLTVFPFLVLLGGGGDTQNIKLFLDLMVFIGVLYLGFFSFRLFKATANIKEKFLFSFASILTLAGLVWFIGVLYLGWG